MDGRAEIVGIGPPPSGIIENGVPAYVEAVQAVEPRTGLLKLTHHELRKIFGQHH